MWPGGKMDASVSSGEGQYEEIDLEAGFGGAPAAPLSRSSRRRASEGSSRPHHRHRRNDSTSMVTFAPDQARRPSYPFVRNASSTQSKPASSSMETMPYSVSELSRADQLSRRNSDAVSEFSSGTRGYMTALSNLPSMESSQEFENAQVRTRWMYTRVPSRPRELRIVQWELTPGTLTFLRTDEPLVVFDLKELVWRKDGLYGIEFGAMDAHSDQPLASTKACSQFMSLPQDLEISPASNDQLSDDSGKSGDHFQLLVENAKAQAKTGPRYLEGFRIYSEDLREVSRWWEILETFRASQPASQVSPIEPSKITTASSVIIFEAVSEEDAQFQPSQIAAIGVLPVTPSAAVSSPPVSFNCSVDKLSELGECLETSLHHLESTSLKLIDRIASTGDSVPSSRRGSASVPFNGEAGYDTAPAPSISELKAPSRLALLELKDSIELLYQRRNSIKVARANIPAKFEFDAEETVDEVTPSAATSPPSLSADAARSALQGMVEADRDLRQAVEGILQYSRRASSQAKSDSDEPDGADILLELTCGQLEQLAETACSILDQREATLDRLKSRFGTDEQHQVQQPPDDELESTLRGPDLVALKDAAGPKNERSLMPESATMSLAAQTIEEEDEGRDVLGDTMISSFNTFRNKLSEGAHDTLDPSIAISATRFGI